MLKSASTGRHSGLNFTLNKPCGWYQQRSSPECRQPTRDAGPWTPPTHSNVCQQHQSHSLTDVNMTLPPNMTNDNQNAADLGKPSATKIRVASVPPSFIRPMDRPPPGISQEVCGQGRLSQGDATVATTATQGACFLFAQLPAARL